MEHTVRNQVIFITGAGGGMGGATAIELAQRGAYVVLGDLDDAAVATTAAQCDGRALAVHLDVTDPSSCDAAVAAALEKHGRIDAVWANAGISAYGPVDLLPDRTWQKVIDVNLLGAYRIIRAALPHVVASRGYIAVTGSWSNFSQQPGHSAYSASKAGIEALANAVRNEVSADGVRVGVFHPGWIETAMVREHLESDPAFTLMFESTAPPFDKTVTIEEIVPHFVRAFERRSDRMIFPKRGWVLHALRPIMQTSFFTGASRRLAPAIRDAFVAQQRGSGTEAGMSERYRRLSESEATR